MFELCIYLFNKYICLNLIRKLDVLQLRNCTYYFLFHVKPLFFFSFFFPLWTTYLTIVLFREKLDGLKSKKVNMALKSNIYYYCADFPHFKEVMG